MNVGRNRRLATLAVAGAFGLFFSATLHARGTTGCESVVGALACQDLGPFVASAVKINVTRKDGRSSYQRVRTTVRFTNTSAQPLILAYRLRSQKVTDDNGHAYNKNAGYRDERMVSGIGVVGGGSADPQFVLQPGESRDAAFEGLLQYGGANLVPGTVFGHDLTIVQLQVLSAAQVRSVRDYAVSFSNLTDGKRAAGPGGNAPGAQPAEVARQFIDAVKKK